MTSNVNVVGLMDEGYTYLSGEIKDAVRLALKQVDLDGDTLRWRDRRSIPVLVSQSFESSSGRGYNYFLLHPELTWCFLLLVAPQPKALRLDLDQVPAWMKDKAAYTVAIQIQPPSHLISVSDDFLLSEEELQELTARKDDPLSLKAAELLKGYAKESQALRQGLRTVRAYLEDGQTWSTREAGNHVKNMIYDFDGVIEHKPFTQVTEDDLVLGRNE